MLKSEKISLSAVLTLCFILTPVTSSANVVWPSLYIVQGLNSWYIILSGFVLEWVFIKLFAKQAIFKAGLISLAMNVISAAVGIILIPASGIVGELILMPFDGGTFATSHWILSYIFAVLGNVLIEGISINYIFKIKKAFWWLLVANAISVIICIFAFGFTLDSIRI